MEPDNPYIVLIFPLTIGLILLARKLLKPGRRVAWWYPLVAATVAITLTIIPSPEAEQFLTFEIIPMFVVFTLLHWLFVILLTRLPILEAIPLISLVSVFNVFVFFRPMETCPNQWCPNVVEQPLTTALFFATAWPSLALIPYGLYRGLERLLLRLPILAAFNLQARMLAASLVIVLVAASSGAGLIVANSRSQATSTSPTQSTIAQYQKIIQATLPAIGSGSPKQTTTEESPPVNTPRSVAQKPTSFSAIQNESSDQTSQPAPTSPTESSGQPQPQSPAPTDGTIAQPSPMTSNDGSASVVVFTATVPAYTPAEDTLILFVGNDQYPMTKIGANRWQVKVNKSELGIGTQTYAYSRSRLGYLSGERLNQDVKEFDWNSIRSVNLDQAKSIEDAVSSWRLIATDGPPTLRIDSSYQSTSITPRVSGQTFLAGFLLQDYWTGAFRDLIKPTNQEILGANGNAVMIAPPWDYETIDPLPDLTYQTKKVPAYPKGELTSHIKAAKNAGLKVILEPQICCSLTEAQNKSDAWWQQWYKEVEEFYTFHAEIAAQTGVEAIYYMWNHFGLPGQTGSPSWAAEKWQSILAETRKRFSGTIGYTVLLNNGNPDTLTGVPVWPPEALSLNFDAWSVALWRDTTKNDTASQAEFTSSLDKIFTKGLKPLYDQTGKPIIITPAYPSGEGASSETDVNKYGGAMWQKEPGPVKIDHTVQAKIYEAIMQAVAKNSFVVGAFPFGYQFVDAPNAYDYSVRAKPAAEVLKNWYGRMK